MWKTKQTKQNYRLAATKFWMAAEHLKCALINLPVKVHRRISARMSSRDDDFGGDIRRFWIEKLDYGAQYDLGLDLIEETPEEFGYDPSHF